MTDPVDTDALRDLANDNLRIGTWHGQVTAALYAAADEVDRLRAAIDNAPQGDDCASGTMVNVEEFYPCSCWKADAL